MMVLTPLSTVILASMVGAKVELYTNLVCRVHPPKFQPTSPDLNFFWPNTLRNFPHPISTQTFDDFTPCSSDPGVQAAVAKFTTVTTTVTGILTFISVGWWGSFSDRRGRSRTMRIFASGQLLSPLIIIFVAKYVDVLPGGYWFLLLDGLIEGAIGGTAGEFAATLAYLSDVTTPEKRSGIFSVLMGSYLAGIGVGPLLGSLVFRTTDSLLWVFYLAAALKFFQLSWVWFLPESLTTGKMQRASARHQEIYLPRSERLFFFLEPLSLLLPKKISNLNSSKVGKRDWNLTFLALCYGAMLLASASLLNQFLYAVITFQWDTEYLGYCLSSIGVARAVFLILILPFAIKVVKDRRTKTFNSHPNSEHEPLLSDRNRPEHPSPQTYAIDLGIAHFSILVDIAMYALLPFAPTGAIFILFITLGSFGAALLPAMNSLALELYTRKVGKNATVESGKLLGAMSVVQAMFASVLGPPMYGFIYSATVATHPRTIFFVAVGNSVVALIFLAFVRVAPDAGDSEHDA
ncbi:major facilitator superfamily domain-containing protein [Mycena galopus ATCC 62051]|nr:major facilitator superfamily domain-containing protein [Mycena galopus ATCC 62051]